MTRDERHPPPMAEPPSEPPAPDSLESIPGAAGRPFGGVAVSSASELHPGWAWGSTLAVVLAGGLTLYAARTALGSALDRWLPMWQPPPEAAASELPAAPPEPVGDAEPIEPEWTFVDIEAAVRPLPESTESLIAEGRSELPEFRGMASADQTRALLIRNRWRLWGRIWHNRVAQIRRPMPPAEACDVHAALEPTCRAVRECLTILDRIPAAGSVEEAGELLEQASAVLEELRRGAATAAADSAVP